MDLMTVKRLARELAATYSLTFEDAHARVLVAMSFKLHIQNTWGDSALNPYQVKLIRAAFEETKHTFPQPSATEPTDESVELAMRKVADHIASLPTIDLPPLRLPEWWGRPTFISLDSPPTNDPTLAYFRTIRRRHGKTEAPALMRFIHVATWQHEKPRSTWARRSWDKLMDRARLAWYWLTGT